ncbi:MAG: hypothetical protein V1800_10090 [Candidatus Latescibacterota bacterium]
MSSVQAESGFKRFFRRLFHWTVGLLVVFILGAVAARFVLYHPAAEKLLRGETALEQARLQIAAQEAEEDSLNRWLAEVRARLETSHADNQALQAEVDAAGLYVTLLSVLADVTGARLALASNDPASARAYLSNAPAALEHLAALLGAERSNVVVPMQNRLAQAMENLQSDRYAAQSDLNVLANALVQLKGNLMWEYTRKKK